MVPASVKRYLDTRPLPGSWTIEGTGRGGFSAAVVIPALAERAHLFLTLESLARNPAELLARTLVLVVVNHRENADPADKADNLAVLDQLAAGEGVPRELCIGWVDGASPGRELPARGGGVGLARKIGFDLALGRLDWEVDPFLASLDADTLVRSDYLPALAAHFRSTRAGGTVIPFCHQPGTTPAGQSAIERYELFLRHYVLGLSLAGSPYAFHTVGSAMAFRAEPYARMGGMNQRQGGEDFYFLQHLAKTAGVAPLSGTMVYPSSRPSGRVPFGTGPSVARLLAGEAGAVMFYPPGCFRILGEWLALAAGGHQVSGEELLGGAKKLSPHLGQFLERIDLPRVWDNLRRNHPGRHRLAAAFDGWFDGFRTLKLIHHLCDGPFPRVGPEAAVPGLLRWAGLEEGGGIPRQLALLQAAQAGIKVGSCSYPAELKTFFFRRIVV
jgi:hypothetical protein